MSFSEQTSEKTIGVILAGGKSRRMGQDKALLPVGDNNGGTLLDFMRRKLEATDLFDETIICRNQESGGATNTQYLRDINPGLGPIGALHTLSVHYPNHRAMIVPVDMPLLESALFAELCQANTSQYTACYFEGYYFPLLIRFNESAIMQLAKRTKENAFDLSVANFLHDIQERKLITPRDLSQFTNINTAEEWGALQHKIN